MKKGMIVIAPEAAAAAAAAFGWHTFGSESFVLLKKK